MTRLSPAGPSACGARAPSTCVTACVRPISLLTGRGQKGNSGSRETGKLALVLARSVDASFLKYVEALHASFEQLVKMTPVKISDLRRPLPQKCVYLFSENGKPLYVGRTNHFRQRMRQHSIDAAAHNQAVFAFRLAREETGKTEASYSQKGSRMALLLDPEFAAAFSRAKVRVRSMDLRYVEETDQLRQALLEIYAAVVLNTPHNDFETH